MAKTELKPLGKPSSAASGEASEPEPAVRTLADPTKPAKAGLKPLSKPSSAAQAPDPQPEAQNSPLEVVDDAAQQQIVPAKQPRQETALDAVRETQLANLPSTPPAFELGKTSGPVEQSDIYRPRLELVQSVGPLFESGFTIGQIVLAKEETIWGEGYDPLKITLLAGRKQFVEEVPYGSDQQQQYFNNVAEVKAAGFWTEWHGEEAPPVFPRVTYVALIEKPDYVDSPLFGIELGDKLFALSEIRWDSAAYSRAAKPVLTAESGILAKGLHLGFWNYSAKREKLKVNTTTVPVLKFGGFHSPEFVQEIANLPW